jgi:hypothetical protein
MPAYRIQSLFIATIAICILVNSAGAGGIEAVKGKRYALSKQHGPWMIMVATISEPTEGMKVEGKTPEIAADELVYELRQVGIPAYSFSRDEATGQIQTEDRRGRETNKKYKLDKEICVVAGNYDDIEPSSKSGKTAQETLAYVKKLKPACLNEGGIYRETPGQPGPLSGAFLTVNPMLTPDEVQARKRNPELLQINAGMEFSLFDNKGDYSLIIATFKGKSVTKQGEKDLESAFSKLTGQASVDVAYWDAWKTCNALRARGVEAWVFHDRYQSYVTVGSFTQERDPRAFEFAKTFGAKYSNNPSTGQQNLIAEQQTIQDQNGNPKMILFDPEPHMMRVPKYR